MHRFGNTIREYGWVNRQRKLVISKEYLYDLTTDPAEFENLYDHPRVREMSDEGSCILGDLFKVFRDDPSLLPVHVCDRFAEDGEARAIADYTAGMTDRFAMVEHKRLLGTHGRR